MVSLEELNKVSHLAVTQIGERMVPLQPYFDGDEWHLWVPNDSGGLGRLLMPDFVQGRYFARAPARPDDGIVGLLQFLTKRAYFNDVAPVCHAIEHDILGLCAAMWKLSLLFYLKRRGAFGTTEVVATDLEYILVTCRSMLDLVQLALKRLWKRVALTPSSGIKHHVVLRGSLGEMLTTGDRLRSRDEIGTKFHLPDAVLDFYERAAPFALALRSARDAIVHHPTDAPVIFTLEHGFAVPVDRRPFKDLCSWNDVDLAPNRLGPLNRFVAQVVLRTLTVAEDMAATLGGGLLVLPQDVAPGLNVFLRSDYVRVLHRLEDIATAGWGSFADIDL